MLTLPSFAQFFTRPGFKHAALAFLLSASVIDLISVNVVVIFDMIGYSDAWSSFIGLLFQITILCSSYKIGTTIDHNQKYFSATVYLLVTTTITVVSFASTMEINQVYNFWVFQLLLLILFFVLAAALGPIMPVTTEMG